MKFNPLALALAASTFALAPSASAFTITEASGNLAAFGVVIDPVAFTIEIRETWGPATSGNVRLLFEDFTPPSGQDWVITKYVTNNTGNTWTSFGHELLNGDGSGSTDADGLSFAQGSSIPRTSTDFTVLFEDELADRDFLNWFGGMVPDGATTIFSYGLRDNASNSPFFLSQTANVPEPATWAMLIAGFGLVGFAARRRRTVVSA